MKILVDLRSTMPPVRAQGSRGTCMAFATSDAHSHSLGRQSHLSVEYLYYYSVRQMATPDVEAGISLKEVRQALQKEGQPIEADWPYTDPAATPWGPPPQIGRVWKAELIYMTGQLPRIEERLKEQKPIIFNIELTRTFFGATKEQPIVPFTVEIGLGLHSVLAVGLASDADKKLFLIRNSWGTGWGDDGYAWLHAAYLQRHLHSIAYVNENLSTASQNFC